MYNFHMDIFKSARFTFWQMSIFKISLLAIGIAIGAYWSETLLPYALALFVIGIILGLYVVWVWFRQ